MELRFTPATSLNSLKDTEVFVATVPDGLIRVVVSRAGGFLDLTIAVHSESRWRPTDDEMQSICDRFFTSHGKRHENPKMDSKMEISTVMERFA